VRLAWIEVRDFRNYREATLEVPAGLTAVVGPNGQGKTNLLEAMYYLCGLRSPRVRGDLPLVRVGAEAAFVRGEAETAGGRLLIELEIRPSGRSRALVNRSPVRRRRDLRRHVRAVFSGPDDLHVVEGDPEERRRFMDEGVAALWPLREGAATAYERALRQRNRLLKDWEGSVGGHGGMGGEPLPGMAVLPGPAGLGAWDEELVVHGTALTTGREDAVGAVRGPAALEFRRVSGDGLSVEYRPSVERAEGEGLEDAFRRRLAERRTDELTRRTSLVGPHRDELAMSVEGLAARGFASHGEAWAAAVCLRLALATAVSEETRDPPMLLLDDPFSGLDPERRLRLSAGVGGRGQVLLAVPDQAHVPPGAAVWHVKEGAVVPE
jgi:DNA replication and repair protein RecF